MLHTTRTSSRGASIRDVAIPRQAEQRDDLTTERTKREPTKDTELKLSLKTACFLFKFILLNLIIRLTAMTTLTMREKLITYFADAEDSKVQAVYTLLEREIEDVDDTFVLTDEHYQILHEERALYLKGEGKSYTPEESIQIAKGLRDF